MATPSFADEAAQKELQEFVAFEQQKAMLHEQIHNYTDMCWDKCIGKVGTKLDKYEENCLGNCVERFLDTSEWLVKRLQSMSGKQ